MVQRVGRSGVRVKTRLVLFVDDDESIRTLYGGALRAAGLAVEEVATVTEAIKVATHARPDLVILDRDLLDGDGWNVARAMRKLDATKSIPILAFTSHQLRSDRDGALLAGCNVFLGKPCAIEELVGQAFRLLGLEELEVSRSS